MFFKAIIIALRLCRKALGESSHTYEGLASDFSTKPCPTTMIANIAYDTLLYYKQKTHDAS